MERSSRLLFCQKMGEVLRSTNLHLSDAGSACFKIYWRKEKTNADHKTDTPIRSAQEIEILMDVCVPKYNKYL